MSDAMRRLVDRVRDDPRFLAALLADPARAAKEYDLTDAERAAIGANTAGRLSEMGEALRAGCGSQGTTCTSTCTATCTVTFTSIVREEVRPQ